MLPIKWSLLTAEADDLNQLADSTLRLSNFKVYGTNAPLLYKQLILQLMV